MIKTQITVLHFGARRVPRPLASLRCCQLNDPAEIDAAIQGAKRVVVIGSEADLASVLTRLMRSERLDIEVAHVPGRRGARRALTGVARRIPLVRDETATAVAGAALWLPPGDSAVLRGEAVVDDIVLFDGEVTGVRIEPTTGMPGLRAAVLTGHRRRWVTGRAVQLGTVGAQVVRDGVTGSREVKRSTFYRHTTGWLRVD